MAGSEKSEAGIPSSSRMSFGGPVSPSSPVTSPPSPRKTIHATPSTRAMRARQMMSSASTKVAVTKLLSSLTTPAREDSSGNHGLKKSMSVDLGDGVQLTEAMIAEFQQCFELFDKSGDGSVSAQEVGEVMMQLGVELTEDKLKQMVEEVDKDGSGELEFPEFIQLMARQMREGTEEREFREMFLMLSGGEKLVTVVAVRSMLYKLCCLSADSDHQMAVSEMAELMDEALDVVAPSDNDVMTFSQFRRMMQFGASS